MKNFVGALAGGTSHCHREWTRRLAPLKSRSITAIIDISNKCNIRCRMCHFALDNVFYRKAEFMDPSKFRLVAEKLFPYSHTVWLSASNEPLTSPHFREILQIAAEYEIPDLKFLTNGLLLTPELIDEIIASKVAQVHVSIDGATRETYEDIRRGGRFGVLLDNLRRLTARKRQLESRTPLLQFNITLMRRNLDELEAFVDLGEEFGVERIAARHVMPYAGLDMETEALSSHKQLANQRFRGFLERVARSSVILSNFPEFYADDEPNEGGEVCAGVIDQPEPGPAAPSQALDGRLLGAMDFPTGGRLSSSSTIEFSGWALDRLGPVSVSFFRDLGAGEPADRADERGLVPLGDARFFFGARSDIATLHPDYPMRHRNAWKFQVGPELLCAREIDDGLERNYEGRIIIEARTPDGRHLVLGQKTLVAEAIDDQPPFVFCEKPFANVHVDVGGNVFPYPDCQSIDAFGVIQEDTDFREVWFGERFSELRQRILAGDPPPMCLNCGYFINRNVDDPAYTAEREIEIHGYIEKLTEGPDGFEIHGWLLLGREPAHRISAIGPYGNVAVGFELERQDVAALYPKAPLADMAGFAVVALRKWSGENALHDVRISAEHAQGVFSCRIRAPRDIHWEGALALRDGAELVL